MPIDGRGNYLKYEIDVIDIDVSIFFGLEMMKKEVWYVNEVTNDFLSHANPELKAPIVFKRNHRSLERAQSVALYTRVELGKLHSRFAYPFAEKLFNLFRRTQQENLTSDTRGVLRIS